MEDVARAAGVSKATVSRVLAGIPNGATEATAQEVRRTASALGYVVNSLASSLRSRQSFTVGLVLADVSNPFFGRIASGVEARLSQKGYSVILGNTGNDIARERAIVRVLVEKQIDGLIVAPSTTASEHLREAQERGVKLVLIDSEIPDLAADSVTIDNEGGARVAVEHLLALGHRRIALVSGPLVASFDVQRRDGYYAALRAAGVAPDPSLVVPGDLCVDGGRDAVSRILRLQPRPTAIFVSNNMMALGAMVALAEAGVAVPEEISVVAFDEEDWYAITNPPLTGVANSAFDMGQGAAGFLLDAIEAAMPRDQRHERLPAALSLRASTRRLRALQAVAAPEAALGGDR